MPIWQYSPQWIISPSFLSWNQRSFSRTAGSSGGTYPSFPV